MAVHPVRSLFNHCVRDPQITQLRGQACTASICDSGTSQERCERHKDYLDALPIYQKVRMTWRRLCEELPSPRHAMARLVHPAGQRKPASATRWLRHARYAAWHVPIDLHSSDHVRLDALLVRPPSLNGVPNLPTMVYVPGNAVHMEHVLPEARQWAEAFGIQVLLYDGRGVGRSLGKECASQDAIQDCCAALAKAQELSAHVGVYGFSLGGALTARALERRVRHGAAPVELYINENSFRSTRHVAKNWFGTCEGNIMGACQGLLHFDSLNAAKSLHRTPLAQRVLVAYTPGDRMIGEGARLHEAVNRPCAANRVEVLANRADDDDETDAHHEFHRHRGVYQALGAWSRAARPQSSV